MTHILAVSPHLDDAAFSVGGLLAAHAADGGRVTIVTCFTGNVARPAGFALACQLDKGLPADADYMALRRAEDLAACAVIGASALHLPFLEAPHRGYGDVPALFGARRDDDGLVEPLAEALARIIALQRPDLLLGPLGLGGHVDHLVVRDALRHVAGPYLLWEDWPYADRPGVAADGPPERRIRLTDATRAARLAMCSAYTTQVGFQFGGTARLADRLAGIVEERLHPATARPVLA